MTTFASNVLLVQAKAWLRARIDEGARCPCCNQFAKVYKRKINSAMAKALIQFYRAGGTTQFIHGPTLLGGARADEGKLRYWGLLEEETERRPDGGRAGYWRVTPVGELFVQGKSTVYKYARVYDGRCLGLVGDQVTIKDALADKFDYAELMRT